MRRRSFIETAALGTAVIGCGGVTVRPELAETDARALAARLELGMRRLNDEPFGTLVHGAPETRPDLRERVLRITIESLLVLDVLRSITEGASIPSTLAEVLAPRMSTLDRAVHTHHALLSRMPAERRRNLDARLRERPELAMDVAEWIDRHATELGVPLDNRLRIRNSAMTIGTRMRRQSTNAVVSDCTAKLDELFARQSVPLAPDLAASTARVVDVLWRQVDESSDLAAPGVASPRMAPVPMPAGDPLVVPDRFGAASEMANPT